MLRTGRSRVKLSADRVTVALWALGPRERVCLAAPRKAALQQRTHQEPGYESSRKGGLFLARLTSGEL